MADAAQAIDDLSCEQIIEKLQIMPVQDAKQVLETLAGFWHNVGWRKGVEAGGARGSRQGYERGYIEGTAVGWAGACEQFREKCEAGSPPRAVYTALMDVLVRWKARQDGVPVPLVPPDKMADDTPQ